MSVASGTLVTPAEPWAAQTAAAFDSWRAWMLAGGIAARTRAERPRVIAQAARQIGANPFEFTTMQLITWLGTFPGPSTRDSYYSIQLAWHAWLRNVDLRTDDPTKRIPRPKVPRRRPHPTSTAQIEKVLASRMHRRTRAMILLAAYQGLRASEVAAVQGRDIDLDENTIRVLGKGGIEDWLPLHPAIADLATGFPRRSWWFRSYADPTRHVHGNTVSDVVSKAMHRAGVDATAHDLRHWFGTELVRSGADLRTAQTLLRHGNLQTTAIYVAVASSARADAILQLPRIGGERTSPPDSAPAR